MVVLYAKEDGVTLGYPLALLGLVLLPLIWWWNRTSLLGGTVGRRRLALGVRMLLFIVLVLALTDPRRLATTRDAHVIWLVDVSRSVDGEGIVSAKDLHVKAGARPGKESWIAFAKTGVLKDSEDELEGVLAAEAGDRETNLAGALNLADASFPAGRVKTVALVSDGLETKGDVRGLVDSLKAAGVRVLSFPAAPPEKPEVLLRGVNAPRQVREEEPFRVEVEISSNEETEAEVDVFRNGVRVATRVEKLKPGTTRLEFTQTLRGDERVSEFSAEVRSKVDTVADNNRASTLVRSDGLSKVLLLSDKPAQARYLATALKQEGILLDARPEAGAPTRMADLQNYDLVIVDNVPATVFTRDQMDLLASYVRDFGGGLLMTGGDQSFGLGGYYRTPIEEILPVRSDFEKEKNTPSLGIVFVIDRSGSMSGEKIEMAKEAAKVSLELLSSQDFVGVVAFDNQAFWVADFQSAANKGAIEQKIASLLEGGGTNLAAGMELAFPALRDSSAKLRHAILLTDGVSTPGPFYELASQMAGQRITVSTVAVGGGADADLLRQIATWGGGRSYVAMDPQVVPQIFTKETMTASKSAIKEAPFVPVVVRPAEFLADVNFSSSPFLLGYVTTRLKPTAEAWLATETGEPLLATWRYGLGQTGAWTSDARNRWAVEWLRWDGFGKFWAQVVRQLARSEAVRKFPVELREEGDEMVFRVDTVDASGRFLGGLDGEIVVSAPDGVRRELVLEKTAAGHYEARWKAGLVGAWNMQAVFKSKGEIVERQSVGLVTGYPEEFVPQAPDEELLRFLAEETGGAYGAEAEAMLWEDERSATEERELWPWLAGVALLLFLIDVVLKRWPHPQVSRVGSKPVVS